MVAAYQPDQRGDQHHDPDVNGHHSCGYMEEDDLDRGALFEVIRRKEEAPDQARKQARRCKEGRKRQDPARKSHEFHWICVFP